jgi:hypothetical protein
VNRRAAPPAQKGFWAKLPRLLAMLAIALQVVVLQPHVHGFAQAHALTDAAAIAVNHDDSAPSVVDCVVCRAGVAGRVFTPPVAIEAPTPTAIPTSHVERTRVTRVIAAASHSWRSRSPPLSHS